MGNGLKFGWLMVAVVWATAGGAATAGRRMESLGRGVVAARIDDGRVWIGWRLRKDDPKDVGFHVYQTRDGETRRVTGEPLTGPTSWVHESEKAGGAYSVRPAGEDPAQEASRAAATLDDPYFEIPIRPIDGYRAGDCSAADLDGDGEFEIVVHQVGRSRDNSFAGITSPPVLDAYKLDGTFLWRIDLGINIREGEHYTQFMVHDLDGDGRAEIACKTADGTKDGTGKVIGDAAKDWRNKDEGSQRYGRILEGPEYFTIFDGRSGAELATTGYIPGRDPIHGWGGIGGNGGNDSYGNRCDRFLACVAYLDGELPSVVMCRGVYGRTVLAAWDWRDGKLTSRWVFDSGISMPPFKDASPYSGMGGHGISVADVDDDGRDEILYQAMAVDDNGKGLYSTGRRHGDSIQVGDFDPRRPGLETMLVSENEDDTVRFRTPGAGMHDSRTGKVLWSHSPGVDLSEGIVADIDPRHPGCEVWGSRQPLRTARGKPIGDAPRAGDWVIWWDGDPLREIYGRYAIWKWNPEEAGLKRIFSVSEREGGSRRRGWMRAMRPLLTADLVGDWREEILLPAPGGGAIRLYTTTIPTDRRMVTLMQDPQYRLAVAWQNVSYNKPPQPGFYLGADPGSGGKPATAAVEPDAGATRGEPAQ